MNALITRNNVIVGADCAGDHHREIHADRYFFDGGDDEGYENEEEAEEALLEHQAHTRILGYYEAAGLPKPLATSEEWKSNERMFDRDRVVIRQPKKDEPKKAEPLPWYRRTTPNPDRLGGIHGATEDEA